MVDAELPQRQETDANSITVITVIVWMEQPT
jgi:hypothetical protein